MGKINDFVNWANNNGWNVTCENSDIKYLPNVLMERYIIPNAYKEFLKNIKICANSEDNIWFLCIDDYLKEEENTFRWNEFEKISLGVAEENEEMINGIKEYWDKHFPIIFNVRGEYEYYAINIENRKIVYGYEPMFEESKIVAKDFDELLEKIINKEIEL